MITRNVVLESKDGELFQNVKLCKDNKIIHHFIISIDNVDCSELIVCFANWNDYEIFNPPDDICETII